MKRILLGLAAAAMMIGSAYAMDPAMYSNSSMGKILTDDKGMTLYTYDKDTKGASMSTCVDKCIAAWPPFLAADGAMASGDWTIVNVKDKDGMMKKMWAYDGWPLYYFVKDKAAGDTTGDGVGGVWHVVKEGM